MKKLTILLIFAATLILFVAIGPNSKKRLTRSDDMRDILHLSAELSSKNYQNFIMASKKNGDSLDYKRLDSIRQASDLRIKKQIDSVVNEIYN
jgi:hypothetical protein